MVTLLQQIACQFEATAPTKAKELRRIDQVYIAYDFHQNAISNASHASEADHLLHFLPRMARMKDFRLYRIGVGARQNGGYARQAVAVLDAQHLPTPGNTLAVLDPQGVEGIGTGEHDSRQYSFEIWQALQYRYGRGCALLTTRQPLALPIEAIAL